MQTPAQSNTLFEIDRELDLLLDEIQEQAEANGSEEVSPELLGRFQQFCHAHSEKVDRIGQFLSLMESREDRLPPRIIIDGRESRAET